MTRRHTPVAIVYPSPTAQPIVVGAVPTFATKTRFGAGSQIGIHTAGNLAMAIPVQHPIPAQGAKFPAFPFVLNSDVAPDAIRPAEMTAQNFFSPNSHSKAKHTDEPIAATKPDPNAVGFTMPKKVLHGTGGHYTIPAPPGIPDYPVFYNRLAR